MKTIARATVILLAAVMLIPMALTVTNSFKNRYEHYGPARFLPRSFTLEGYAQLFAYPVARWTANTLLIIAGGTAIGVVVTVAAGMAVARYQFRGRRVVFWGVILSTIIPMQALIIPSFLVVRAYGLFNTLWALILPGALSLPVLWFMVRYMEQIPEDLYSMGRIDGLGVAGLLVHVTVPMAAPVIAAFIAQRAVSGWADFLGPLIMLRREELYTLVVGINEVVVREAETRPGEDMNPSIRFAGAALIMAPAVALFLATQRYFADGMFAKGGK